MPRSRLASRGLRMPAARNPVTGCESRVRSPPVAASRPAGCREAAPDAAPDRGAPMGPWTAARGARAIPGQADPKARSSAAFAHVSRTIRDPFDGASRTILSLIPVVSARHPAETAAHGPGDGAPKRDPLCLFLTFSRHLRVVRCQVPAISPARGRAGSLTPFGRMGRQVLKVARGCHRLRGPRPSLRPTGSPTRWETSVGSIRHPGPVGVRFRREPPKSP